MAEQNKAKPSKKTGATAIGGIGGGALVVWLASLAGLEMPAEVGATIAGAIAAVISWLVPATSGKYVDTEAARNKQPKH